MAKSKQSVVARWVVAGALGVVVAALVLGFGWRARSLTAASGCASNLRTFVDTVGTHLSAAEDNQFESGASAIQALVDAGLLNSGQLRCPVTGAEYVFVLARASRRTRLDPELVVAFEPLTDQHGEGGCVAYADGHVEFLPTEKYRAAVAGIERD